MEDNVSISRADRQDLPDILKLQKLAFQSEAAIYGTCAVSPLAQTLEGIQKEFDSKVFLKMTLDSRIIGSIRIAENLRVVRLEKLIVHPDFQNSGLGGRLIRAAESQFPRAEAYELMTGKKSVKNIHVYTRHGYKIVREEVKPDGSEMVWLEKSPVDHFVSDWMDAWNDHDLERILSHYSDDFEMRSPMIARFTDDVSGVLKGKEAVSAYWAKALQKVPDLHFELMAVFKGVEGVAIQYRGVGGRVVTEVFSFGMDGRVVKAHAYYEEL